MILLLIAITELEWVEWENDDDLPCPATSATSCRHTAATRALQIMLKGERKKERTRENENESYEQRRERSHDIFDDGARKK